jgi:hypothetical protein
MGIGAGGTDGTPVCTLIGGIGVDRLALVCARKEVVLTLQQRVYLCLEEYKY